MDNTHIRTTAYGSRTIKPMQLYGVSRDLETAAEGKVEGGECTYKNNYIEGYNEMVEAKLNAAAGIYETEIDAAKGETSVNTNNSSTPALKSQSVKLPIKYKYVHDTTYESRLKQLKEASIGRTLILGFNFDNTLYKFKTPFKLRYSENMDEMHYKCIATLLKDCNKLGVELMMNTSETDVTKIQEKLDFCKDLGIVITYVNGINIVSDKKTNYLIEYHMLLDARSGLQESYTMAVQLLMYIESLKAKK